MSGAAKPARASAATKGRPAGSTSVGSKPAGSVAVAASGRRLSLTSLPVYAAIAAVVGSLALVFTGAAAPTLLGDAGPLVRFGLPIAEFAFDTLMALTLGALLLAVFVIPRTQGRRGDVDPTWLAVMGIAQTAAALWTLTSVAVLILTYIATAGAQAYQGDLGGQLSSFVTEIDLGRIWLVLVVLIAVLSVLVFAVRSYLGVGLTTLFSMLTLVPQALMGHSAGASGHMEAVNSLGIHLVGVVAWTGGLLVLCLLAPRLAGRRDLDALIGRFSVIALIAFVLVVYSGVFNASVRVGPEDVFGTRYGLVVVAKALLSLGLGALGFAHRRYVIGRLAAGGDRVRLLFRLLLGEVVLFAGTMSLAVVLSRSQPPIPDEPPAQPTPSELLTGEPLPPRPSWGAYFTEWRLDPLWILIPTAMMVLYALAYLRLRRRGDAWPIGRLISWMLGMCMLIYVTCGGPAVYGMVLFSGHMIQHMALVMVVPLPMVFGAPITLLMRAVPARRDGSRGPREWVLGAIHSPYLRFWAHPIVAAINFSGSLVVFYHAGLMEPALSTHIGHQLMVVHFLAAGYMFAQSLIGIDPGVNRFPYPIRLVVLLVTMAFHAFFGISIMSATALIAGDWYGNMGHGWGFTALEDQVAGGEVAWGIGELPVLIIAISLAVQWTRASGREAKRRDRAEDRTGDAELNAYNEMLARLAAQDERGGPRGR